MKARDIVVIGTSAGGLSALKKLLAQLPPDLPATILIVQHLSPAHSSNLERLGELTSFTCPDCHGSLWRLTEDKFIRFRCRTGHAYTAEALLTEQNLALENILRDALRCAVEQSTMAMDLIDHARRTNDQETIGPWNAELRKAGRRMHLIQEVLNHQSE
jgi:two-component system chemotaxis response regulator CheB